ncbi:Sideroflexin-5 [Allomyces javanicus]|nr:Sideroflexin-5 [Allomyces javanicus]
MSAAELHASASAAAAAPAAAPIPAGFPDLTQPRFDQNSYLGRLKHFLEMTDPRTLLASSGELARAKQLMVDYGNGVIDPTLTADEYWRAKKLYSATYHPDTGEKVFLPFRMSSYCPTNMLIIAGMLMPNQTTATILFWQWLNQSVNVAINYSNANQTNPMSVPEATAAYAVAVTTSCTVALGLSRWAAKRALPKPVATVLIPFTAVALAGSANVFLMRQKELREGITVTDEEGNELGQSRVAGRQALSQVALSRVLTAAPCLVIPTAVVSRLEKRAYFAKNPRMLVPINLALIAASLMSALPCAIAMFPQYARVPVTKLEREFQNRVDAKGNPITHVVYNKGL